jgi:hypothetical protein
MKKLIYLFMASMLVFTTACDPMEDIHDALDAQESVISGEVEFAMSDDDYDFLGLGYGTFNSEEDAKAMIPDLLADKYPVWGDGSLANVSFQIYAPKRDERSLEIYTVSTADYDSYDDTAQYNNFDDMDQVYRLLDDLYPSPADRLLVSLTYKFYSGSVSTLNNGFLYVSGEWNFVQGFTADEYEAMGEGYPNFSSEDEADAKIPVFLKDKFKYSDKSAGDIEAIMYKLYVGGGVTESYVKYFIFDGANWSAYNNEVTGTVKFGHDGNAWVPDNTIKYTLTGADITIMTNALGASYPGPTSNVAQYGSFDRREGSGNYWSDDMLVEGFNFVLDNLNPSAQEGQKYVVTYIVYTGATGNEDMKLIKSGGSWILNN